MLEYEFDSLFFDNGPSKDRGCSGKLNLGRKYIKNADRLGIKNGKVYGVYRCPHCNGTHLTTKLANASNHKKLLHVTKEMI